MTDQQLHALAAQVLAEQAARRAVREQIKRREGWHKLSQVSAAVISRLAREHLAEHPEMIAAAEADPIVAEMSAPRRRSPRR